MQNPSDLTTRATRKTTRFGTRDAKYNAAGAMHRASMGATELQSNWPEMRKTLGKPGFLSGEDRNRTFLHFSCIFFAAGRKNHPSNDSADPASNEPLRISLGIVAEHGAGVDRVSKMLAEPLVL
jgi:hypothetical protein